jgi:rhamnogalacturonyl hydrolase YesR
VPWWWCDALFMAPPVWAKMYKATGERKYLDYVHEQWRVTSDLLYDKDEHLYARDASYIGKTEPNGRKVFWSRGEGWVMGGLARTIDYIPQDDPRRAFYIGQLREMSAKIASLQDPQGLWHAGLLDPGTYPLPEISGSALFVYGMAYGVNRGYLDEATYRPVIEKAWAGILKNRRSTVRRPVSIMAWAASCWRRRNSRKWPKAGKWRRNEPSCTGAGLPHETQARP